MWAAVFLHSNAQVNRAAGYQLFNFIPNRRSGSTVRNSTMLGHRNLQTTMLYTHVLEVTRKVTSPLDELYRGHLDIMADDRFSEGFAWLRSGLKRSFQSVLLDVCYGRLADTTCTWNAYIFKLKCALIGHLSHNRFTP